MNIQPGTGHMSTPFNSQIAGNLGIIYLSYIDQKLNISQEYDIVSATKNNLFTDV